MDISMKDWVSISDVQLKIFVKLRSRSRSGEGQVRVRKLRELKTQGFGPEPYNIFGFHPPPTLHHHKLFSQLLRGLDISDGSRIGWYDSSRV